MSRPDVADGASGRLPSVRGDGDGGAVPTALLERLQYVTDAALSHVTVEELLDEILDRVRDALRCDSATALMVEAPESTLVVVATRGLEGQIERGARVPLVGGNVVWTGAEQRAIVVDDVTRADVGLPFLRAEGVSSLLAAPLRTGGAIIGLIQIGVRQPRTFVEDEARLLQLVADRAALALDHARLFESERQARLESEAALRARDEFLAIAAHELKTPLTTVKTAAQLLTRGLRHPDRQREELAGLATTLEDQIARLELQVADLLDSSRLRSGHVGLRIEPVELVELCESVIAQIAQAPERTPKHTLRLEYTEPIDVTWDRGRMERALISLATNALNWLPDGGDVVLQPRRAGERAEVFIIGRAATPSTPRTATGSDDVKGDPRRGRDSLMAGLFITTQTIEEHGGSFHINADIDNVTYSIDVPFAPPS